jgi:hypothetical protein
MPEVTLQDATLATRRLSCAMAYLLPAEGMPDLAPSSAEVDAAAADIHRALAHLGRPVGKPEAPPAVALPEGLAEDLEGIKGRIDSLHVRLDRIDRRLDAATPGAIAPEALRRLAGDASRALGDGLNFAYVDAADLAAAVRALSSPEAR